MRGVDELRRGPLRHSRMNPTQGTRSNRERVRIPGNASSSTARQEALRSPSAHASRCASQGRGQRVEAPAGPALPTSRARPTVRPHLAPLQDTCRSTPRLAALGSRSLETRATAAGEYEHAVTLAARLGRLHSSGAHGWTSHTPELSPGETTQTGSHVAKGAGYSPTHRAHRASERPARRRPAALPLRLVAWTMSMRRAAARSAVASTVRYLAAAQPASKPSPAPKQAAGCAANPAANGGGASIRRSTPC